MGRCWERRHAWVAVYSTILPSEGMQAFAKHVSDYSKSHFNVTVHPDSVDLAYSAALYDSVMIAR